MFLKPIRRHASKALALFTLITALVVAGFSPFTSRPAQAGSPTSIVVNSMSDNSSTCAIGGTACLRNAITQANSSVNTAGVIITFSVSGTITLTTDLPTITNTASPVTIDGSGQFIAIDGTHNWQMLYFGSNTVGALKDLTLLNGSPTSGHGGAITNAGTLNATYIFTSGDTALFGNGAIQNTSTGTMSLVSSVIYNNGTSGYDSGAGISNSGTLNISFTSLHNNIANNGAAISNIGTLKIDTSTFYGNTGVNGAAIENTSGGVLKISSSTFYNNTVSGVGGAIYTSGGNVTISNSTFSGNAAGTDQSGGGIYAENGLMSIGNSTFSRNSASFGAGIYNNPSGSTLNLLSTISAGNTLTGNRPNGPDVFGPVTSVGFNLIGDGTTSTGLSNGLNGDQVGTANAPLNPQLGPLQGNGGLTLTIGFSETSLAFQRGNCGGASNAGPKLDKIYTDQRGISRKQQFNSLYSGTGCDVGAFELPNIDTIGIFRSGTFYLRLHNSQGFSDQSVTFNPPGKNWPIVGDWTGSGHDTVGVYDQNSGRFTLCTAATTAACASTTNQYTFLLGNPNDTPLAGRWLLTATQAGAGVYRSTNGILYLKNTLTTGFADFAEVLGSPGDIGVAGDWTGKGYDSPGIYRPTESKFYLSNQVINGIVFSDITALYGNPGDFPVIGDWVAQGHDGIGLFRQSVGYTYLRNAVNTGVADNAFFYGSAGDVPVAGHWQAAYPPVAPPAAPILIPKTATPVSPPSNNSAPGSNQIGG